MKIGIVGWGIEGQSAFNYFGSDHEYLIVNEEPRGDFPAQSEKVKVQFLDKEKPPGVTSNVSDLSYLDGLEQCDKIIYSPTARKNLEKKFGDKLEFWNKTTTERHIFFETVNTKNIIGVTGTKGKGTTSTLIFQMLTSAGKRAFLGGNIGRSVLDFVRDVTPDDWVVLELSSFQLYKFPYSPHIGVCLMITPEHLDWHPNLEDYLEAKSNLFTHQEPDGIAIYFDQNEYSRQLAFRSPGTKIPYYQHPGARVREDGKIVIGEVKYYDDSFGTSPETAIVAMKTFAQPKVMILGGSDKGIPFDNLAKEVTENNVRHVVTIGDTGAKITELLRRQGFGNITEGDKTMTEIVSAAQKAAQPGDVVLLSTASASFDLFHDYKDRGNQFKQAVQSLGH
jgi:UDP-N-acetylmuramoylalanine-D-glutamate ligase